MTRKLLQTAPLLLLLALGRTNAADSTNLATTNSTALSSLVKTNASVTPTNSVTTTNSSKSSSRDYESRSSRDSKSSRSRSKSGSNTSNSSEASETGTNGTFGSFQLISERNIFNPNRRPRVVATVRSTYVPTQVDTFALWGTSSFEKQTNAFFDGSSFQYRKTVSPGDVIANYKVLAIGGDYVILGASSNATVTIRVGMQMRRQDGGPWSLIGGSAAALASLDTPVVPTTTDGGTDTTSSASAAPGSSAGGDAADVLKRMMERRAKEK